MKKYKYVLNTMLYYDYEYLENLLNKMATHGWELCEIGNFFFKFRQVETVPKKFAVVYDKEGSSLEFEEASLAFDDYCMAAGWEKLVDSGKLKVFQTTDLNAVPIETDESIRLESIKESVRKTLIPINVTLGILSCIIFSIVWQAHNIDFLPIDASGPLYILSNWDRIAVIAFLGLLPIMIFLDLIVYKVWAVKSEHNISKGGYCADTKWMRWISVSMIIVMILAAVAFLANMVFQGYVQGAISAVVNVLAFAVIVMIGRKVLAKLKGTGASKGINFMIIFGLCLVLILARNMLTDKIFSQEEPVQSSPSAGTIFFYTEASYTEQSNTYYELCEVRAEFLKEWALNQMLTRYDYGAFVKTDEPQWNADEVYKFIVDEQKYIDRFEYQEDVDYEFLNRLQYRRLLVEDNNLIYVFSDRVPSEEDFLDQVL